MITAVVKQHVRKRTNTLIAGDKEPIPFNRLTLRKRIGRKSKLRQAVIKNAIVPVPPAEKEPEVQGKDWGRFWKIIYPVLGAAFGVLILLFILAVQLGFINLKALPGLPGEISLHEDTAYERALFSYIVSEDVSLTELEEGASERTSQVDGLKLSTHVMKAGETVASIAARYNLNIDTIISYNNITRVKSLKPGDQLLIPSINGIKYRVSRGDNLSSIANRYKIPLNTLLDWNNITSSVIMVGTEYFIPGAKMRKNDLNRALGKLFVYPAVGRFTSGFGWRADPIGGHKSFHNGIDLANSKGTAVRAAMDGEVIKVSYSRVYGKYIIIKHDDGFQTLYGHFSQQQVSQGQYVLQGKQIGLMGNTGYSTGNHVHFAIFKNGEPVNPYNYLK